MKTSNKLLLGFFLLVIVVITVGLVILKVEINKLSLSSNKANDYNNQNIKELAQTNASVSNEIFVANYIDFV
jgi:hypothetical protein